MMSTEEGPTTRGIKSTGSDDRTIPAAMVDYDDEDFHDDPLLSRGVPKELLLQHRVS